MPDMYRHPTLKGAAMKISSFLISFLLCVAPMSYAASETHPMKEEAIDICESFIRSYTWARSNKSSEELTANLFKISKTWLAKRNLSPIKTKVNGRRIDRIELIQYSPPKVVFIGLVNDNIPFAKLIFEVRREDGEVVIVPEKIAPENREWIEPYRYVVVPESQRSTDKDFISYYSLAQEKQSQNASRAANKSQNSSTRQLCEAQKMTCFASCPAYRSVSWKENSRIVNGDHFDCKSHCESISCY